MAKGLAVKDIPLSKIDTDDETYLFRYKIEARQLSDSIKKVGLISPIYLTPRKPHSVVSGFRRLQAHKLLKRKQIKAFMLDRSLCHTDCVLLTLSDNYYNGSLNDIDKAFALNKLKKVFLFNDKKLLKMAQLLELPKSMEIIRYYLKIGEFNNKIKDGYLDGSLSLNQLFLLTKLTDKERSDVYRNIIVNCKLNTNELKQVIANLKLIGERKNKDISGVLKIDSIKKLLDNKYLKPRQRADMLSGLLRSLVYPALTKKSKEFQRIARKLNINIDYPENFEGDFLKVHLKPRSYQEFYDMLKLSKDKKKLLSDLFRLIK